MADSFFVLFEGDVQSRHQAPVSHEDTEPPSPAGLQECDELTKEGNYFQLHALPAVTFPNSGGVCSPDYHCVDSFGF